MRAEMNDQEKQLYEVSMRYTERFGDGELLPLMQLPASMSDPEAQISLYERCLREGKPAREIVQIGTDPDAIY